MIEILFYVKQKIVFYTQKFYIRIHRYYHYFYFKIQRFSSSSRFVYTKIIDHKVIAGLYSSCVNLTKLSIFVITVRFHKKKLI